VQLEEVLIRHPRLRLYVIQYGSPLVDEMIAVSAVRALSLHLGRYVTHVTWDARPRITHVFAESIDRRERINVPVDVLVLAAGTLTTARILFDSAWGKRARSAD